MVGHDHDGGEYEHVDAEVEDRTVPDEAVEADALELARTTMLIR